MRTDYSFDVFVLFRSEGGLLRKIKEVSGAEGESEGFVEVREVVVDLGRDEGCELSGGEGGILGKGFAVQVVVSESVPSTRLARCDDGHFGELLRDLGPGGVHEAVDVLERVRLQLDRFLVQQRKQRSFAHTRRQSPQITAVGHDSPAD